MTDGINGLFGSAAGLTSIAGLSAAFAEHSSDTVLATPAPKAGLDLGGPK